MHCATLGWMQHQCVIGRGSWKLHGWVPRAGYGGAQSWVWGSTVRQWMEGTSCRDSDHLLLFMGYCFSGNRPMDFFPRSEPNRLPDFQLICKADKLIALHLLRVCCTLLLRGKSLEKWPSQCDTRGRWRSPVLLHAGLCSAVICFSRAGIWPILKQLSFVFLLESSCVARRQRYEEGCSCPCAQQMDGSPQLVAASVSPQSQNHRISQIGRDPQGSLSLTPASS